MLGKDAEDASDRGVDDGEVDAADKVERNEVEVEMSDNERPSCDSCLFLGCSKGSSPSSSRSELYSSSSCGHRYPVESVPKVFT